LQNNFYHYDAFCPALTGDFSNRFVFGLIAFTKTNRTQGKACYTIKNFKTSQLEDHQLPLVVESQF